MPGMSKGSMHYADMLGCTSSATCAVPSGLGLSGSCCPLGWLPYDLGTDAGFVGQAAVAGGEAAGPESTLGFSTRTASSTSYNFGGSQLAERGSYPQCTGSSNTGGSELTQLSSCHGSGCNHAAREVGACSSGGHNIASPGSGWVAAESCSSTHTASTRACTAHQRQLVSKLWQQQQQNADTAANPFTLQRQQEAVLAHATAVNSSTAAAAAHAQLAALYGSYGRMANEAHPSASQRRTWDCSATAAGPSCYANSHPHNQHAAVSLGLQQPSQQQQQQHQLQQQQQHMQATTGAARLPPPLVGISSYQQQQQQHCQHGFWQSPAGFSSSIVDCRQTAHMLQQHGQHSQLTVSSSSSSSSASEVALNAAAPTAAASPAAPGHAVFMHCSSATQLDSPVTGELSLGFDGNSGYVFGHDDDELCLTGIRSGCICQPRHCNTATVAAMATALGGHAFGGQQQQQQQLLLWQLYSHHVEVAQAEIDEQLASLIEESSSTKNDSKSPLDSGGKEGEEQGSGADAPADQTACDIAVLVADWAGAAAKQSVPLQMLTHAAAARKGHLPPASLAAAVAAGSESACRRLLISQVSLYASNAANSQLALDQANTLLTKMRLPDGVQYMPVRPDSFLFSAGAAWHFPAFVICLGSSYLQRMLARLPQLAEAALACPGFEEYGAWLPHHLQPAVLPPRLCGADAMAILAMLRSVQFTCLFLATKVADKVHALGLLCFMLTNLSHNGAVVSREQAAIVEAGCLDALEWRLGPFFLEDELSGEDEELWAQSMGHWDYGTTRDSYPEAFSSL